MTLSVEWFDVISRRSRIQTVHIWPYASFATLLESQGYSGAEVDPCDYYAVDDAWSKFGMGFPYLVVDVKVAWNIDYRDAIVRDIVDSLGPDGKRIRIQVGFPGAGGPDLLDVARLWQLFYDALKAIDPVLGTASATVAALAGVRRWLNKPQHGLAKIPPGAVFSFVVSRKEWTVDDLARMARISEKDANLLVLCRYRLNKRRSVYTRTRETSRVVKRLNAIEQADV